MLSTWDYDLERKTCFHMFRKDLKPYPLLFYMVRWQRTLHMFII